MSLLNQIQKDLQSKIPPKGAIEQVKIIDEPPEQKPEHYETDIDALNGRYRLINAICNLEFLNSKERINTMLDIQKEIKYTDDQLNELMPIYAPKLVNKVVGKYTHLQNLLLYAGIRKPDPVPDKGPIDKKRVRRR